MIRRWVGRLRTWEKGAWSAINLGSPYSKASSSIHPTYNTSYWMGCKPKGGNESKLHTHNGPSLNLCPTSVHPRASRLSSTTGSAFCSSSKVCQQFLQTLSKLLDQLVVVLRWWGLVRVRPSRDTVTTSSRSGRANTRGSQVRVNSRTSRLRRARTSASSML